MAKKSAAKKKSAAAVAVALVLALGGTFALQSVNQDVFAERETYVNPGGRLHYDFSGWQASPYNGGVCTEDVYVENFGTEPIYARVRLDEYMEIGVGAGLKQGADLKEAVPLMSGASLDDPTTWHTHIPGSADLGRDSGDAAAFHTYWDWVMGGEDPANPEGKTVYMPTFNKNGDSLAPDVNGTMNGGNANAKVQYTDWVNYNVGDEATGVRDLSVPRGAFYDADDNTVDEGSGKGYGNGGAEIDNFTIVPETHTAKETLSAGVCTMNAWKNTLSEAQKSAHGWWVYDADGWAYWSRPIAPDTATGLLLDRAVPDGEALSALGQRWYYAIHAVGQFTTGDDLGRNNGTGFYTDPEENPSDDALELLSSIGVDTGLLGSITLEALCVDMENYDGYRNSSMLTPMTFATPNMRSVMAVTLDNGTDIVKTFDKNTYTDAGGWTISLNGRTATNETAGVEITLAGGSGSSRFTKLSATEMFGANLGTSVATSTQYLCLAVAGDETAGEQLTLTAVPTTHNGLERVLTLPIVAEKAQIKIASSQIPKVGENWLWPTPEGDMRFYPYLTTNGNRLDLPQAFTVSLNTTGGTYATGTGVQAQAVTYGSSGIIDEPASSASFILPQDGVDYYDILLSAGESETAEKIVLDIQCDTAEYASLTRQMNVFLTYDLINYLDASGSDLNFYKEYPYVQYTTVIAGESKKLVAMAVEGNTGDPMDGWTYTYTIDRPDLATVTQGAEVHNGVTYPNFEVAVSEDAPRQLDGEPIYLTVTAGKDGVAYQLANLCELKVADLDEYVYDCGLAITAYNEGTSLGTTIPDTTVTIDGMEWYVVGMGTPVLSQAYANSKGETETGDYDTILNSATRMRVKRGMNGPRTGVLLMSKYVLDGRRFDDDSDLWPDSEIETYLNTNGSFALGNGSLSTGWLTDKPTIRQKVMEVSIQNTLGDPITYDYTDYCYSDDRIFLLGSYDINTAISEYRCGETSSGDPAAWWTRDQGYTQNTETLEQEYVPGTVLTVDEYGETAGVAYSETLGVRPLFWYDVQDVIDSRRTAAYNANVHIYDENDVDVTGQTLSAAADGSMLEFSVKNLVEGLEKVSYWDWSLTYDSGSGSGVSYETSIDTYTTMCRVTVTSAAAEGTVVRLTATDQDGEANYVLIQVGESAGGSTGSAKTVIKDSGGNDVTGTIIYLGASASDRTLTYTAELDSGGQLMLLGGYTWTMEYDTTQLGASTTPSGFSMTFNESDDNCTVTIAGGTPAGVYATLTATDTVNNLSSSVTLSTFASRDAALLAALQ